MSNLEMNETSEASMTQTQNARDEAVGGARSVQAGSTEFEHGASSRFVFGLAILSSAFLLFQAQLIMGKFLLPWFGGTSMVWTTCMLFYQVLLLAGYAYAHGIARRWPLRRQGIVHLMLLAVTVLLVLNAEFVWQSPFLPGEYWMPSPDA